MATRTSVGAGNWSTAGTWDTGVPVVGDKVVLNHMVTLDTTGLVGGDDTSTAIVANAGGGIIASRVASSDLTVRGDITFNNNSVTDLGTIASPMNNPAITCTILLNDSASPSNDKWGAIWLDGAIFYAYGVARTRNTILTNTGGIASGATTMDVEDGTNWQVGDTLVIQQTDGTLNHADVVTISTITPISGTAYTVTFGATSYSHDENARVGNFTSNVRLTANNPTYRANYDFNHSTANIAGERYVYNTEFSWFIGNTAGACMTNGGGKTTKVWSAMESNAYYEVQTSGVSYFNDWSNIEVKDTAYYNNYGAGIAIAQGVSITFTRCVIYQCQNSAFVSSYSQGGSGCIINDTHICQANYGFQIQPSIGLIVNDSTVTFVNTGAVLATAGSVTFNRCSFASSDLVGVTKMGRFGHNNPNGNCPIKLNDCKFISSFSSGFAPLINTANPAQEYILSNKDVDPNVQEIYKQSGTIVRDNTSKISGVTSLKMSPISTTDTLTFDILIPAPSGNKIGVSGFLWRDTANVATVTLSGLGITPSVYTASGALSANEQFEVSGTQTTGTDGFLTLTIAVTGASGNMWVDGVSAPQAAAINFGEFGFWANGLPAPLVAASFVAASDVWNTLADNVTVSGSMGELVKVTEQKTDDNQALIISK